ncbi:peroxiredoxin [Halovivax cerinus]|uniref:thioredoxin-dependent peroxiredoxin n=1 Tax=Halovivax cerinus TaxID=1487865 RepID=A0ABD5NP57_9EURY|nr:peroxiredoxin [Halovivax cerinus]
MLQPGEAAPDFELLNHEGEPVERSDFEGQPLILYFYPKAGTEGCTAQACSFRDSWDAFEETDAQVVGVSTDSVEEIRAFRDRQNLPFPLVSDEDGAVARAYESFDVVEVDGETHEIARRNTYVIDESGVIEAVYEDVSPENHATEMIAAIEGEA